MSLIVEELAETELTIQPIPVTAEERNLLGLIRRPNACPAISITTKSKLAYTSFYDISAPI